MKRLLIFTATLAVLILLLTTKGFTQLPPAWWANNFYMETYQNGIGFGNGLILDGRNEPLKFNGKSLNDLNKDIYFQEDFEGDTVTFNCGANLTASDDSSTPIAETTSKVITQAAGALGQNCESPFVTLDEKQKNNLNQICINGKGENFDLVAYDVTNAEELGRLSFTNTQKPYCLEFKTESTTNEISYRLEAALEVISSELKFDDVQLLTNPLSATEIYASSDWQDCEMTPSDFSAAFGTVTSIDDLCRRDGSDLLISVKFLPGTVTGLQAEVTPRYKGNTIIIDNKIGTRIPSGRVLRDTASVPNDGTPLLTGGLSYIEFGPANSTGAGPHSARPVDEICATGAFCSFEARIPIAGWLDKTNGVIVKNISDFSGTENDWFAEVNTPSCSTASSKEYPQEWLSCVSAGTNICTCTYDPSIFPSSTPPHIQCTSTTVQDVACDVFSGNTFRVLCQNNSGASNVACDVNVKATKSKDDFIKESEKVYTVPIGFKESESYYTDLQINFWDSTFNVLTWDSSLIVNQNQLSNSNSIEISNGSTPDGAATKIIAKQNVDIFVVCTGHVNSGNLVAVKNSSGANLDYVIRSDGSNNYTSGKGMVALAKGDYVYCRNSSGFSREGGVNIWVKPSKEEGLWLGRFGQPRAFLKYIEPNGTSGVSGSAGSFVTVPLNTLTGDSSFISLSGVNQFTLSEGTYDIDFRSMCYLSDDCVAAIYDLSAGAFVTDLIGSNGFANDSGGDTVTSSGTSGRLTVTTPTSYELRQRINFSTTGNFGRSASFGLNEVYATINITKVR